MNSMKGVIGKRNNHSAENSPSKEENVREIPPWWGQEVIDMIIINK